MCCLVVVANFAGLYLKSDVQSIVTQLNPDQSHLTAERVDAVMRQFFQRVKLDLHVIVCVRISSTSLLHLQGTPKINHLPYEKLYLRKDSKLLIKFNLQCWQGRV